MASSSNDSPGFDPQTSDNCTVVDPNDRTLREHDDWNQQNILSLDGGGVRGYYSLLHLQHLMRLIKDEEEKQEKKSPTCDARRTRLSSFSPCDEPDHVSHFHVGRPPFLPCHYFDYISGTSTGALITIMLTTLRMPVEDCLEEYKDLAGAVFGSPSIFHRNGNPLGFVIKNYKFSTKNLEYAIKDVMRRRGELTNDHDDAMQFTTPKGLCRAWVHLGRNDYWSPQLTIGRIVLAIRDVMNQNKPKLLSTAWLFRSYDNFYVRDGHEEGQQPHQSRSRANGPINPGRGTKLAAWKVARAATAALFYFEPLEIALEDGEVLPGRRPSRINTTLSLDRTRKRRAWDRILKKRPTVIFTDAGSSRENNPSAQVLDELDTIFRNRHKKPANWVSIGTARPPPPHNGSRLVRMFMNLMSTAGDPDIVHLEMERRSERAGFHYYRLNEVNGLSGVEMDEWKPRTGQDSGRHTIETMRNAFRNWLDDPNNYRELQEAAENLVRIRRARVSDVSRWERFALGRFFVCGEDDCPYDTDETWNYRVDFIEHLRTAHPRCKNLSETEMEAKLRKCSQEWNYKPRLRDGIRI